MSRYPRLSGLPARRHAAAFLAAAGIFTLGTVVGAAFKPSLNPALAAVAPAQGPGAEPIEQAETPAQLGHRLDPAIVYPAELIRIIDGDTFEARVRVWPGLDVDTKVRLRGIDAAELHARCADELAKAQAARTALTTILGEGGLAISHVGVDKYGGRIDATVSTRGTADVSAALLNGGFARAYDGGRRGSWCG